MRLSRSTITAAATTLALVGGGGVAWACTGPGMGDPGGYTGTTSTTGTTGTTGTTTTTTTTSDPSTTGSSASITAGKRHAAVRHHSKRHAKHSTRR
jgi:hypothetical protein